MIQEIRKKGVCDIVGDSGECLYMAECTQYDGLILTNNIRGQSALELCPELRVRGVDAPIVYITPFPTSVEKILFLNSGADIYLPSYAPVEEFHAEFMVSLRRVLVAKIDTAVKFKGFCLNLHNRRLYFGEQVVHITKKEYELLEYFAFNIGRIMTSELLLEHVWDLGLETASNTLIVHIRNIRLKFSKYTPEQVIENKRGRGYILTA
ncbi:hypothetical protein A2425_03425 [candidate division WWE3 bacterium RIFOXYC1_FULL_42_17]|uniref:OmpR/PhoB-type domain-containing protein n=1 Tax=candidate division WWE3 bacterium RIFOXYB1_FULL_42_27 TaxID=1802638 RepID=A0A1F4VZ51_UNCKA|nr:MAG: hypothetical protein A2200_01660 [candidate division WWE3 bacterium RIFOXYA1_FULL_41_11]OGC62441.1 MAG: hypothetical protein A2399_00305 [candidate division WWE3 bacterium RIFOXYB1_FULL_42_27]OGC71643.1 MAG: hypothetical protein A2578_03320 [candidate division WWE3 bacterium RIFOXYD1_FULL_42_24]OGC74255.1 MAG: hypothetical protein A2425_03425 [candidate division WWE3 bacterium RIFOXYC1_FULL_42_17]